MPGTVKTWSVPTSPRSPFKIPKDLALLRNFEGRVWDRKTQTEFGEILADSEEYEGLVIRNLDFAARDRINRSPKTFGFVTLEDRRVHITDAGEMLMNETSVEDLFTRQLLKWQYPSANHTDASYRNFKIKPFLEILRLAKDLDGLTKREIAIFGVSLIDYRNYESTRLAILAYREQLIKLRGPAKNRFIQDTHANTYRRIFADELVATELRIRENQGRQVTPEKFIRTKMRTSMDYADSAIRYFRATGLFKLSANTFRLQPVEQKSEIISEIIRNSDREPVAFSQDRAAFLEYLGNPNIPVLPDDRVEVLQQEIKQLIGIAERDGQIPREHVLALDSEILDGLSPIQLKVRRRDIETLLIKGAQSNQKLALQSYELYDDVISVFDKIVSRADYDIPDKPLFFEWNTRRAFAMLNDGNVTSNAVMDIEGKPLHTAPGGGADGVCYYTNFALAVEVTLTRGARQFEAESESVPRHVGKLSQDLRNQNDQRPVFGIFIASGLNPATIAHFYVLRKTNIMHYGGQARILPIELADFKQMLEVARDAGGVWSDQIQRFLEWTDVQSQTAESEVAWYETVRSQIPNWVSI